MDNEGKEQICDFALIPVSQTFKEKNSLKNWGVKSACFMFTSAHQSIHLSACLPICASVCLCIYQSICQSISQQFLNEFVYSIVSLFDRTVMVYSRDLFHIRKTIHSILTSNNWTSVNPCNSLSLVSADSSSLRCVSANETITRHKPLDASCYNRNKFQTSNITG